MKTFYLQFDGSWPDSLRDQLPEYCGIYLVYRGILSRGNLYCHEIIYIGQADNIRNRHIKHEKYSQFLSECRSNEILFYSCAPVKKADLNCVENALIYKMRPKLNDKQINSFPYDTTSIVSSGQCAMLISEFTVERKDL